MCHRLFFASSSVAAAAKLSRQGYSIKFYDANKALDLNIQARPLFLSLSL